MYMLTSGGQQVGVPNAAGKEVLYWSLQFVTSERYKQRQSGSKVGCTAASIALGSSCSLGNIYTDSYLLSRYSLHAGSRSARSRVELVDKQTGKLVL